MDTATGQLLPEHMLLGLRLTVGEDVLPKPHPPSKLGRGNFPDQKKRSKEEENYYPGAGYQAISTYGKDKK